MNKRLLGILFFSFLSLSLMAQSNDSIIYMNSTDTTFVLSLPEVEITAKIPAVIVRSDTLEFNASAFQMYPDAVVEDLLKRLPGVEIKADGKILVNGKEVKKILVDGKEFFGNDSKIATEYLKAEIIDKVQVIDKKSDTALRTGVEDGEKETIINLKIKKGMLDGWIGDAGVGLGSFVENIGDGTARYTGNLMLNRFTEKIQHSILLNSNNINSYGSSGSLPGMDGGMGGGENTYTSAGYNFYNTFSEKFKVGGNVNYNYSDAAGKNKSFRQDILMDSVSYNESNSENHSYTNNLNAGTQIEFEPDSLNKFYLSGSLSFNKSLNSNSSYQHTLAGDRDSTMVNRSNSRSENDSKSIGGYASLLYARKFKHSKRRLNFSVNLNLNNNDNQGHNNSLNEFLLQPDKNKDYRQESFSETTTNTWSLGVSYVEPIGKKGHSLQISYKISQNNNYNVRNTYDFDSISGNYSDLNYEYSKSLTNHYLNQTITMAFNASKEKYSYNAGLNIIPSYIKSKTYIENGSFNGNDSIVNNIPGRNVIDYAPQFFFNYRINKNSNLYFDYNGNTNQPDVRQLDPTPDNTNPLYITMGNPDLRPSFYNNISFRYSNYNPESQHSLFLMANASFVLNEIINITNYEAETGVRYNRPINENGSWNMNANGNYSLPLGSKKEFRLSSSVFFNYNNRIGYVAVGDVEERNKSGTLGAGGNINFSFNNKWLYNQLNTSYQYNITSNSVENRGDMSSSLIRMYYDMNLKFPRDWSVVMNLDYSINRGLAAGYNTDRIRWNAGISKQFLRKKQLTASLTWSDILNKNQTISRHVTASSIQDNEYNALSSYFILSLSYKLNEMGGK